MSQSTHPQVESDDHHSQSRKIFTKINSFPLSKETKKPTEVLECDTKTADNHVPRDI